MKNRQIVKTFTGAVMHFHNSPKATARCVCRVNDGIGYDAFDNKYCTITDDFGNIVFVQYVYRFAR